MKIQHYFW